MLIDKTLNFLQSSANQENARRQPVEERGRQKRSKGRGRGVRSGRVVCNIPAKVRAQNAKRNLQAEREAAAAKALTRKKAFHSTTIWQKHNTVIKSYQ